MVCSFGLFWVMGACGCVLVTQARWLCGSLAPILAKKGEKNSGMVFIFDSV